MQDFLILELKSFNLKYLYSGFDGIRPEILDFGSYEFERADWKDLFFSFSESLRELVKQKLPAFHQLETYLILPHEFSVEARVRAFEYLSQNIDGWDHWEMRQSLVEDQSGYQVQSITRHKPDDSGIMEKNALAVRNRHLARIGSILKERSLFLSGIYLPQMLWKDILEMTAHDSSCKMIIYKEDESLLCVFWNINGSFQMKWYHERKSRRDSEEGPEIQLIERISENVANSISSAPGLTEMPVLVFEGNMDQDEISVLEEKIGDNLGFFPSERLEENSYSPGQIEYLMTYCAHKKASELYIKS
ncbi:MAG: hypothetical protein GWO41_06965 [candidate division Zixibacteria bacterium]|nr:hypothetical protein [candidate division Zixibacteria bacterium]NIR62923.1 hypothetical protein [candidate division Zixibacteria bacterium]NIS16060.1 hypothetical protein [candidate division Zixibacteria bacterium]NIS44933.1 hypothetical protein [candidate division Zixibacteria bacterium]NIT52471.1 hypothetical protein [candidate division Zixibacteria bacterium]